MPLLLIISEGWNGASNEELCAGGMQCEECSVQCAVSMNSVQCVVKKVQCAVCTVYCAVCNDLDKCTVFNLKCATF